MCGMARLKGDWQRAARYIADRRAELRLTQQQVKDAGGPSPATLTLIENGGRASIQASIAGSLERALRWAPGSIRAVLEGGEPVPLPERRGNPDVLTTQEMIAEAHKDMDELERLDDELHRRLQIARRSAEDKRRAVSALRLVQGELDETPPE